MFKLSFLIFFILSSFSAATALPPDFFKRQKKTEKGRKLRLRGASDYTKKRKRSLKSKESEAVGYRAVRKKKEKEQSKRDVIFKANMSSSEIENLWRIKEARNYAKKKRRVKPESWKNQNLEYDIKVLEPKNFKKKKK